MGCDIHWVLEEKQKDGTWLGMSCSQVNVMAREKARDYGFFTELAGVRGMSPTAQKPSGFPDDASILSQRLYESWGSDAHTPSWLSLDEFRDAKVRAKPSWMIKDEAPLFQYAERDCRTMRVVFWFDN